jgi:hypothetical protein
VYIELAGPDSTLSAQTISWDKPENYIGRISADHCLSGISIQSTDAQFNALIAAACRDYGVQILGFATQGNMIHAYGVEGVGVYLPNGGIINSIEGETCGTGIELFGGGEFGTFKAFSNTYRGILIEAFQVMVHAINATHASKASTGHAYPEGYALAVVGWCDSFVCPALNIYAPGATGGFRLGRALSKAHVMAEIRTAGRIFGDGSTTGTYGFEVDQPLVGSVFDLTIGGFEHGVYFHDATTITSLAGNSFHFRGASSNTVRWPDGTTGTFDSPNTPTSVSNTNEVTFHVY